MSDDVKSPSVERLTWLQDELEPWLDKHFKDHPEHQSVLAAVAQYWADEADDAVHLTLLASKSAVPDFFSSEWDEGAKGDTVGVGWSNRPSWDDNGLSIRSFQGLCGEGGSQELPSSDQAEPFLLAQRQAKGHRITWLGRSQRPWLDLPNTALPGFLAEEELDEAPPPPPPSTNPAAGLEFRLVETPDRLDREPLDLVLPAQTLEAADLKCLEAIASDPFAEGPRRVWADMWLARNDPRGTFMQERSPSRAALIDKGEFWLGELNRVVPLASAVWEYGSLAQADAVFSDDTLNLVESPWWLSVHTIRFSSEDELFSKQMRGLRHVSGLTSVGLLALAGFEAATKLESLQVTLSMAELDALRALPLTSLKSLSLTIADADLSKLKLPTSTWLKLEHVRLCRAWTPTYEWDEENGDGSNAEMPSVAELRAALPQVPRVSVCAADSSGLPAGWDLSLTKGVEDVATLRLERLGPAARRALLDAQLEGLPASVKTVALEPSVIFQPDSTFRVGGGRKAVVNKAP